MLINWDGQWAQLAMSTVMDLMTSLLGLMGCMLEALRVLEAHM